MWGDRRGEEGGGGGGIYIYKIQANQTKTNKKSEQSRSKVGSQTTLVKLVSYS